MRDAVPCLLRAPRSARPAASSGHLSLDPLPQAPAEAPGQPTWEAPGVFFWATCAAREGGIFEKGHKVEGGGRFPGRGARLKATEKGAGAKGRASAPLGDPERPYGRSWKLFSHVVTQRVTE